MRLHEVNREVVKNKKPNRLGRGLGTGQGKTAGRGHKGQGSRAGWNQPASFQGGMSPLVRRIPKRGFHNAGALIVGTVNLYDIEASYNNGEEVNRETLKAKNLLKGRYDVLKILGTGDLSKKVKISAHRVSGTAKEKIEKSGSELIMLAERTPVADKQLAIKNEKRASAKKK
jgi:large subunit ribosomal protein L15